MPALALFLGNLFSGLLAQLGAFATKLAAGAVLTVGLAATAAATCWTFLSLLISTISTSIPSAVVIPATWIVPSNFMFCLQTIVSAEIAIAAYRWTRSVALGAVSSAQ